MSGKGGGFPDHLFGGLFDFNGDGVEDPGEQFLGFGLLEELFRDERYDEDDDLPEDDSDPFAED